MSAVMRREPNVLQCPINSSWLLGTDENAQAASMQVRDVYILPDPHAYIGRAPTRVLPGSQTYPNSQYFSLQCVNL